MRAELSLRSILLALAAMLVAAGCSKEAKENEAAKPEKKEESRVQHGTNGETIVKLTADTQKIMGLQFAPLQVAQLKPELKVYGRVLDPSSLVTAVSELAAARATSEASQAELQRLKTLAGQNNASARSVQAAEATAIRDRGQAESAWLRLLAAWGAGLAEQKDLPALVESLGTLKAVLVQLNSPPDELLKDTPRGARVFTLNDETNPIRAEFISPAPAVDPQLQAQTFFFLVSPNSQRLTPGTALTGFLELPGEPQTGVAVPASAIVRFNGTKWVYVQTGEDSFARTEVASEHPIENGWFVRSGLKPDEKVVTAGAQEILSEETKD